MIQLYRLAKKMKLLSWIFALLFALLGLSTTAPTHAVPSAIPSVFSPNWSGFAATGPLHTFTKSECTVQVPKVTSPGVVSSWCGLGGIPDSVNPQNPTKGAKQAVLVQAGVDACLNSRFCLGNCRRGVACGSAWWEIADALAVQPVPFRKGIKPGDVVHIYMQSNIRNDGTDVFLIQNLTAPRQETHTIVVNSQGITDNGRSVQINDPNPSKSFPIVTDGASVECIVERSTSTADFSLIPLGDFQSTSIATCNDARVDHLSMEPISNLPTLTKMFLIDDGTIGKSRGNNSSQQTNASSQLIIAGPTDLFCARKNCFTVKQTSDRQTVNGTLRTIGRLPR